MKVLSKIISDSKGSGFAKIAGLLEREKLAAENHPGGGIRRHFHGDLSVFMVGEQADYGPAVWRAGIGTGR